MSAGKVVIRRRKPVGAIAASLLELTKNKAKSTLEEEVVFVEQVEDYEEEQEEDYEEEPVTRVEALAEAMSWIDPVILSLNTDESVCECCSHKKYEDWFEYQLYQKLSGIQDKLQGIINQLQKRRRDLECP